MRKLALVVGAGAVLGILITPATSSAATLARAGAARPADPARQEFAAQNGPSGSDPSASTNVTFHVGAGALTISAPASADLGSGFPNTTIGPTAIGGITVDDTRGITPAGWTVTVNGTSNFTDGTGDTIPISAAFYATGVVTHVNIPSLSEFDVTLSTLPQVVVAASGASGGNHANWDPALTVTVPLSSVAGDYSATIVHSVTAS